MVHKDFFRYIKEIETEFPVSEWKINGIDVWPIIRIKLHTKIKTATNSTLTRKSTNYSSYSSLSKFNKIKLVFTSFLRFYRLKKVDFIATSNFSHRSIFQGEYYNKFYDPILDDVNPNGLIIEHNSKNFYTKNPIHNKDKVDFFEDYFFYLHFLFNFLTKIKLYNPLKNIELENYDLFLEKLRKLENQEGASDIRSHFELKSLKSVLLNIKVYSQTYERIIRKTKPKFTFQICHYNANSIALSLASKKMKVPSVEIQHGGQHSHVAYSEWNTIPKHGYNTLPKIFWTWNEASKQNLNSITDSNEFHEALFLGNPWIEFVKNKLNNQEKKYILYSLQPLKFELIFPHYLIQFIKNNKEYKWWFRLHPTDINRKEEYIEFFEKNDMTNHLTFDTGITESLPESLSKALLHVTYSSGTAIEAAEFGVKTIFLDTNSTQDYFGSLIANKDAFLVQEDFEKLVKTVLALKTKTSQAGINYTSCFELLKN